MIRCCLALFVLILASIGPAGSTSLKPGLYAIELRVELPNLGDALPPKTIERCIESAHAATSKGFTVLMENNPLTACPASDETTDDDRLTFQIACPGGNAAKATAVFDLASDRFEGRIKMNMGGKNMTMSEVQRGRRIGDCSGLSQ